MSTTPLSSLAASIANAGADRFHVQGSAKNLRDDFPYFQHHDSVSALWSTKWRPPAARGIYPFMDGDVTDFDPLIEELIRRSGDDAAILQDPDAYAEVFFPGAERLVASAEEALQEGSTTEAARLFLRAAAVYRIARFPVNRSPQSQLAWERGKEAFLRGGELLEPPYEAIDVPFSAADTERGDTERPIPAYLRTPVGTPPAGGWPVLLFVCGLDAYRTDNTPRINRHLADGFAVLAFEIPGTGDSPAAPSDPTSPDRLMTSVLDWVNNEAPSRNLNGARVLMRGISTGGYYAIRAAFTHADRLWAVAEQGGGCHHMFDPTWIRYQNQMEYPFALAEALAYKFGFRSPEGAVDAYAAEAKRFSLLDTGVLDRPDNARLLLVNGMEDSIFPIEDTFIVAARGAHTETVIRADKSHMGNPGGEEIVADWLREAIQ
jgi:pimeloyl-ACP methyl ester carboxylesterase